MPGVLSRRGLIKFSAAWAALVAVGDVAWAATPAAAAPADNPPSHLEYQDSSIMVTIDARPVQDVTVLHCEFTDVAADPETYELSYIDDKTGKESRPRMLNLVPGMTTVVDLYGGLNRSFTIKLCPQPATTTCLMLGPVAAQPAMAAKAIGIRVIR